MCKVAGTGHRPNKLGGYSEEVYQKLVLTAMHYLTILNATEAISGMALGWDMALAQAAINYQIPFIAAVPFGGQESMWPPATRERYHHLLKQAKEVVYVSPPGFSSAKMQKRNEWMVDQLDPTTDKLLAMWDGTNGGTANCLRYANTKGFSIQNGIIINAYQDFLKL